VGLHRVIRLGAGAWQDGPVAGTSGDTSQPNVHAAWRMAQARRAAQAYQPAPKLAALAVAGSVGSGLADRFSDLELDCGIGYALVGAILALNRVYLPHSRLKCSGT
jgi:hypothetical protein